MIRFFALGTIVLSAGVGAPGASVAQSQNGYDVLPVTRGVVVINKQTGNVTQCSSTAVKTAAIIAPQDCKSMGNIGANPQNDLISTVVDEFGVFAQNPHTQAIHLCVASQDSAGNPTGTCQPASTGAIGYQIPSASASIGSVQNAPANKGPVNMSIVRIIGSVPQTSAAKTSANTAGIESGATTKPSTTIAAQTCANGVPMLGGGGCGTVTGNTTLFATSKGAQSSGNLVSIDAFGNHDASGLAVSIPSSDTILGGSVGIGTGTLAHQPASATYGNVAMGYQALASPSMTTTAIVNTAVGYQALNANTSAYGGTAIGWGTLQQNTTGIRNTALGAYGLQLNTTGNFNTGLAFEALQFNTTGSNNTAVGHAAITFNRTGSNNTAVGFNALEFNTVDGNTAVGTFALQNNTTGTSNVAVGANALVGNQTGTDNTAVGGGVLFKNSGSMNTGVGSLALYSNTTGDGNTTIGHHALVNNTTGNSNTAVGVLALLFSTNASNNTAVGTEALIYGTGGNNVAVGSGAGQGVNGSTTTTNSVFLGANAGAGITTGNQNTLIGAGAGTSLTTGGGNIVIGYNEQAPTGSSNNWLNIGGAITGNLSTQQIAIPGSLMVGSSAALALATGEVGLARVAASGSAPGPAGGKLEMVCGTNPGSAKIIVYAGTSTTPATLLDNIGSGVNGC